MTVGRSQRRRPGPGRGRGRARATPARRWSRPRLPAPDRSGPGGAVVARALLFGSAAFLFVYVLAVVVVVDSLLEVVSPVDHPGLASRGNWLLVPLELGGMLGAFAGGVLAAWLLADAGERSRRRLLAWSLTGPLAVGLLLLAVGQFAGGPLRALLDLAVVAAGAWLGVALVARRFAAA